MKRLAAFAVAVASATLMIRPSGFARSSQLGAAEPRASVWDSVYTDSQTVRGDSVYKATCTKCHGATYAGTADGNPLAGPDFIASWDGVTIDQIYDKILNEMPSDDPKTIPRAVVPDLVALILKANAMPAGAKPLPDDPATLKTIKFEKAKPAY